MIKTLLKLILSFTIIAMSGCTISGAYYIRNHSSEALKLSLQLYEKEEGRQEKPIFKYTEGIEEVNRKLYKKLHQTVTGSYTSDLSLEVLVPPQSTLFFARGFNTKLLHIKSISIQSKGETTIIDASEHEKLNIQTYFPGQYSAHIDVH